MNIIAEVENETIMTDTGKTKYSVVSGGRMYTAISDGTQAVRDAIFIRKGQRLSMIGTVDGDSINVERARIDIKSEIDAKPSERKGQI
ncbi:MAG: hypothetical protein K5868_01570 [Lachnospiraceae bacterium]|nr:hypothetical protein [Lachnospiraceae bacterium]